MNGDQPRIGPLSQLPLFHRLNGRRVVVAGVGHGAQWKAELVAAAGGDVEHYLGAETLPGPASDGAGVAAGRMKRIGREWTASDLCGAALAILESRGSAEAEAFVTAARAAGVPVNVIDQPEFCDFTFGSIINRSPVVIGISTNGNAPALAQAIRARIEMLLPRGVGAWADLAGRLRQGLAGRLSEFADRRTFWRRYADMVFDDSCAPDAHAVEGLVRSGIGAGAGRVTLVGAGPGDADLLTIKALRALQAADVVLYDDLVGDDVLDLVRREAERIAVGKRGGQPSTSQGAINARLVALAQAGKQVVRLKGGDPGLFGRAGEEIAACQAAGIPVTVIPGVTAAQGAAAALGLSLTHRDHARRVQFVTGAGAGGQLPADLDWQAIADPSATTIVYMPRRTLAEFVARAMAAGLSPVTPAAIIVDATRPTQVQHFASLEMLCAAAENLRSRDGPALVMIGMVMAERAEADLTPLRSVA